MRGHKALVAVVLFTVASAALGATKLRPEPKLIEASSKGDLPTVKKLIAGGADPNFQDPTHSMITALHWAANMGRLEVVKFLLAHHAKVDIRDAIGATPLMVAAGGGAPADVATALLSAGAAVNARDEQGLTALGYAAKYDGRAAITATLIRKGADIEAETRNFDRPLSLAAEKPNRPVIAELLKAGADGGFALVWEIYHRKPAAVQALLDAGVNVNARYPKAHFGSAPGTTPLIEAADENDLETARTLIARGADTNAIVPGTSNMPTALTLAAYHCNSDMIRLLLDHGADRGFRNASGNSAADLARTGWTSDMRPCSEEIQSLLR